MILEVAETGIFVIFMKFPQKPVFTLKLTLVWNHDFHVKTTFSLKMMKFPLISAYYSKLSWEMEKWVISARKKVNFTRKFHFLLKVSRIFKKFMEFHQTSLNPIILTWISSFPWESWEFSPNRQVGHLILLKRHPRGRYLAAKHLLHPWKP